MADMVAPVDPTAAASPSYRGPLFVGYSAHATDAMTPSWIAPLDPTEAEAFAALRRRLPSLWREVFADEEQHYTSVVVPSVTLESSQLAQMPEHLQYEEVLLFLLIRLRNPRARLVYVTSLPLTPLILDYYLQFLSGIPAPHAAARIRLFAAYDGSPRPLTEKILERPRLIARIRAAIADPSRAYLTVLRSTDLERRLAVRLGLPLNAADPEAERLCAKSSIRRLLASAGIPTPRGVENLRDEKDLLDALAGLRREIPSLRRAIVKLETSFLDEGRALVDLPEDPDRAATRAALRSARVSDPGGNPEAFLQRFEREGGVVEELVEAPHRADASVQLRINPVGQVFLTSTHDEVRGGPLGLDACGCSFPAHDDYRRELQELGLRIGGLLAERGVVSRLSIEFLLHRDREDRPWRLLTSKVNLGVGGSTHPLLAVRLLTDGALDPDSGQFRSPSGRLKFYRCTDRLVSGAYRQLAPEDVIELMTLQQLNYSAHSERGALFYMLGGVSATGRLGMVAIGNSRQEADAVFASAVAVLDAACATPAL
jgi:hypothetical protein